jgi:hypothetical protein
MLVCVSPHQLFYFLLSARLFPFTPNWLLNFSSPWVRCNARQLPLPPLPLPRPPRSPP